MYDIVGQTYDVVGKTYDIVGFLPLGATLTYDITYAIAYDIVGQTYDIVCDGVGNLRHRRPRPPCCLSYPTI